MKQVVNVSVGNRSFVLETDAYEYLKDYLNSYKVNLKGAQEQSTMENLEEKISEILSNQISDVRNVVTFQMVKDVANQIGMPNGNSQSTAYSKNYAYTAQDGTVLKRIYRDTDNKPIGGVCGGLGAYFNIDPIIFRALFLIAFFVFGTGLFLYIILWILLPKAVTPAQKCELRGLPKTAENISRFSSHERR